MRIVSLAIVAVFLTLSTSAYSASYIKGHIDHAGYIGDEFRIRGWACQTTDSQSVRVHIYAGGAAGKGGTFIGHGVANLNSEPAVATSCSSSGTKHRFNLAIPRDKAFTHSHKTLYVHGISTKGTGNKTIHRSGLFRLPLDFKLSYLKPVIANKDVTIKANQTLKLDTSASIKLLLVQGKVQCTNSFNLKTEGVLVMGSGSRIDCGTSSSPFTGNGAFVLSGNRDLRDIDPMNMITSKVTKGLVAMHNGVISLYGKSGKSDVAKLSGTANSGTRTINLDRAVSWQVGDQIVVSASDFDPWETEKRIITSIASNKRSITLNSSLNYKHWGQTERHSNGRSSWTLDERAKVVNLTRNLKVKSDSDSYSANKIGAHMMIMGSGSAGFINNVEFNKVGQQGVLGRYPFHWHKKGNVSGQFFSHSSIHESYNRCVVIHGTNYAKVDNNSCYDHYGHGYFLEDGNEVKNIITNNIGLLSKKIPKGKELLISEVRSSDPNRFPAPATFWISNPDNDVRYNTAAGSEGTGFWMSFRRQVGSARPLSTNTWRFSSNIAHSSIVGITHDGAADGASACGGPCPDPNNRLLVSAHYSPSSVPTFSNLVAYKNALAGIYYRGTRANYPNAILADNGRSAWFAFDQELVNSLVVGYSNNHDANTLQRLKNHLTTNNRNRHGFNMPFRRNFSGMLIYDGPYYMDNVHFAGFPDQFKYFENKDVTPSAVTLMGGSGRYTNLSRRLTFDGAPIKKVTFDYDGNGWGDAFSAVVKDADGSLVGTANRVVMAEHDFNRDPACLLGNPSLGQEEILICNYSISHFRFGGTDKVKMDIKRIAPNGNEVIESSAGYRHFNKFPLIQGSDYVYEVSNYTVSELTRANIEFTTDYVGQASPVIAFKGLPGSCNIRLKKNNQVLTKYYSLQALKNASSGGYYKGVGMYYIRVVAQDKQVFSRNRRAELPQGRTDYALKC